MKFVSSNWSRGAAKGAAAAVILLFLLELPQLVTDSTAVTSYLAKLFFADNFHEVVPGEFYRAGEMSTAKLRETIDRYGLQTVVDLRLNESRREKRIVSKVGAAYYHVPMAAGSIPSYERLERLFRVLDRAKRPILVHCSSGTHRSGLASMIWLLEKQNTEPELAARQLSLKYGYFRLERKIKAFMQKEPTLDTLVWRFLDEHRASGVDFRAWTEEVLPKEPRVAAPGPAKAAGS